MNDYENECVNGQVNDMEGESPDQMDADESPPLAAPIRDGGRQANHQRGEDDPLRPPEREPAEIRSQTLTECKSLQYVEQQHREAGDDGYVSHCGEPSRRSRYARDICSCVPSCSTTT